jgi:hypothetical protein
MTKNMFSSPLFGLSSGPQNTEMNRICLVLIDMSNMVLEILLAPIDRILVSVAKL